MSLPCCVVERCVTEFILQNSHTVINQPVVPGNDKLLRWKWGYPTPAYGYSLILTAFPTFSIWSLAVFVLQAIKTGGRKALGTRLRYAGLVVATTGGRWLGEAWVPLCILTWPLTTTFGIWSSALVHSITEDIHKMIFWIKWCVVVTHSTHRDGHHWQPSVMQLIQIYLDHLQTPEEGSHDSHVTRGRGHMIVMWVERGWCNGQV